MKMKRMLARKLDDRFIPDIYVPDPNRGIAGVLDNPAFKKPSFWGLLIGGGIGSYLLGTGRVLTGLGIMAGTMVVGALAEQKDAPL